MPGDSISYTRKVQYAMGTMMAHQAYGPQAELAIEAVCGTVDWLEALLSRFLPNSDIRRINDSAGISEEKISAETFEVLSRGVEFSRRFPQFFDITIEPLVNLWSKAKDKLTPPDPNQIQETLSLVDWRDLRLDPWGMTATLTSLGSGIDLGGIGKGFAADRVKEVYSQHGITSAFSNLGGNVITLGTKPDGSSWQIGIQHPRDESLLVGSIEIRDQSVVTAGDYQRYFIDRSGIRQHHILNPKNGMPVNSGLASVTIVADNSMTADVLSTIMFSAGKEQALTIRQEFPAVEVVMVDTKMQIFPTAGLRDKFHPAPDIDAVYLG